jgi:hypothetical protein
MRAHAGELNDSGELERTILALHAGAVSPRHFAGRDLLAELLQRQGGNGSFGGLVNHTAFGVLALTAAGASTGAISSATSWLAHQQGGDGGFGFAPGTAGDVDDTGAALQALAAGGRGASDGGVKRGVDFLRRAQHSDGGFGQYKDSASNAQSTSWAVQGLVAVGRDPSSLRRGGHTPLGYIGSLARADGSIAYSKSSSQTPVWVTAQALAALERRPFPLRSVHPRHAGTGGGGGHGGAAGKHARAGRSGTRAATAGAAGAAPGGAAAGAGGVGSQALRRAAERVDGSASRSHLTAAAILLISGAALLVLATAASWRYRRLARHFGEPPGF